MNFKEFYNDFLEDAKEWAQGRFPYFRLALWLFFLYIFIRHIFNFNYSSIFSGVNLGIHELGHIIFSFMPTFVMVVGGTFAQIAAPISSIFAFFRQRDYFAITVSFGWLATSLFEVSRYAGDAEKQLLPLVSPFGGEDIIHDWNYILSKLNILTLTPIISFFFWLSAVASMLIALIWGGWLILLMLKSKK